MHRNFASEAELRRALLAEEAADARYWQPVQPPQGEAASLETLIARAEAYLEKHPDSQRAMTRLAVLEEERAARERTVRQAWQHTDRLAQALEAMQGHECPKLAAQKRGKRLTEMVADLECDVPCWEVAEREGWVCAKVQMRREMERKQAA